MAMRIGDVARLAGVGVETVRFYEREGLIEQPLKPPGGWREYDGATLSQIKLVRLAKQVGLTLDEIKRLKTSAREPKQTFCFAVRETVTARLAVVEAEIDILRTNRTALRDWLSHCEQSQGKQTCSLHSQVSALISSSARRKSR